jgi:hypothetical protein
MPMGVDVIAVVKDQPAALHFHVHDARDFVLVTVDEDEGAGQGGVPASRVRDDPEIHIR